MYSKHETYEVIAGGKYTTNDCWPASDRNKNKFFSDVNECDFKEFSNDCFMPEDAYFNNG